MAKSIDARLEALEARKEADRRGRAILVSEATLKAAGGAAVHFASIYSEPPGPNDKVICLISAGFPAGHPRGAWHGRPSH